MLSGVSDLHWPNTFLRNSKVSWSLLPYVAYFINRESLVQFENRIKPWVDVRCITRSTKFMYFSIKYHYSDILLKHINFIYNRLFFCNHTCYCVGKVSVTPVSRYVTSASRNQSRSSMHIRGLIPRKSTELAEAVLTAYFMWLNNCQSHMTKISSLPC